MSGSNHDDEDGSVAPAPHISVLGLIEEQIRSRPHGIAVVDDSRQWTYQQLSQETSASMQALSDIRPGDRVGVHMKRRGQVVVSLLAILNKGAVYVPLNREYPSERLQYVIDDAGIRTVVTDDYTVCSTFGVQAITLDALTVRTGSAADTDAHTIRSDSPAYFIYTSGSTGLPKGVVIPHRGLTNILQYSRHHFGFGAADSVLALTSFSFDFSVLELLLPLVAGGTLHFTAGNVARDPRALSNTLMERGVTFLMGTPSMFSSLTSAGWRVPSGIKIILGGEELRPDTVRQLSDAQSIWNIYGPTETSIFCTSEWVDRSKDITIGREVSNTEVLIMQGLDAIEDGEVGEICVRGVGVALGYHNKPELTATRFIVDSHTRYGNLYRTGDLGRRRPDGRIDFLGRMDDQVKIRGFRVELGQIEAILRQHPEVKEAAVVVRRHGANALLVAYVVPRGTVNREQEIKRDLLTKLPTHDVPHRIVQISALPLSFNGKVDRMALSELELPPVDTTSPSASEDNDSIVQRLKRSWVSVLGVRNIGLHDNFFDVGGDSLSVLRIVGKARELGLEVSAADIFRSGTLASLAELVDSRSKPVLESQKSCDGPIRLLPAQIRFFERAIPFQSRFRDSLAYKVRVPMKSDVLAACLTKLVERHPALAARFCSINGQRVVRLAAPPESFPLTWRALEDLSEEAREEMCRAELRRMHDAVDPERGPLCLATYFSSPNGTDDVLLFLFHHLVCDGVTLHVLMEDFASTYESLENESHASLPTPSLSAPGYSRLLETFANSEQAEMQGEEWLALPWQDVSRLPCDDPTGSAAPDHIKGFTIVNDGKLVDALRTISRSSVIETEDVFLVALSDGMTSFSGASTVSIDVCSNGRQPPFSTDALHTVGWLAIVCPFVISVPTSASHVARLNAIRQQVRHLRAIAYAWPGLRYMHADSRVRARFSSLPEPELYFNYRGPMQEISLSERYRRYDIQERSPSPSRPHGYSYPVELRVDMSREQLVWRWTYSSAIFKRNQIEALAERVSTSLQEFASISPKTRLARSASL